MIYIATSPKMSQAGSTRRDTAVTMANRAGYSIAARPFGILIANLSYSQSDGSHCLQYFAKQSASSFGVPKHFAQSRFMAGLRAQLLQSATEPPVASNKQNDNLTLSQVMQKGLPPKVSSARQFMSTDPSSDTQSIGDSPKGSRNFRGLLIA